MKRPGRNAPDPGAPTRNGPKRGTPGRPRSRVTEEDLRLWAEVARSIKPLRGKAPPEALAEAPPARKDQAASSARDPDPISRPRDRERPTDAGPLHPPLATLERRLLQRLRRGRTAPGAAIDLHGLRQEEARRRLLAFLHDCQASGKKTAIVITGKGGPDPALAAARLADDGRAHGKRSDVRADAATETAGYEPAVLIQRSALAWFPATGVRARARPGQEQDDRPGE